MLRSEATDLNNELCSGDGSALGLAFYAGPVMRDMVMDQAGANVRTAARQGSSGMAEVTAPWLSNTRLNSAPTAAQEADAMPDSGQLRLQPCTGYAGTARQRPTAAIGTSPHHHMQPALC